MAAAVRDLRDLPLLFVEEKGETKMGATRKTTPEILDKIIQFVWDYKRTHDDETPSQSVIERHIGNMAAGSIYYFVNLLIDEGRVNKISSRPFRMTITDHPKNRNAIERFKRLLAKKEEFERQERERIRAEQEQTKSAEQVEQDKQALFNASTTEPAPATVTMVRERPAQAAQQRDPDQLTQTVTRFAETRSVALEAQREVRAYIPKLLKVADERDLVYELVSRGYTVSRQR